MGKVAGHMLNPQTWRTRGSLFVWLLPSDLSDIGDPVRSKRLLLA